jgi:DnaJ-class molecular chaperone
MPKAPEPKAPAQPQVSAQAAKPAKAKVCPTCNGTRTHPGDPSAVLWCPECGGKGTV